MEILAQVKGRAAADTEIFFDNTMFEDVVPPADDDPSLRQFRLTHLNMPQ